MSNDQEDSYNDSNRAFLQALIARSILTVEEAKSVLATILAAYKRETVQSEDVTSTVLEQYISEANDAVSAFDMEVRSTVHQVTKQRVYAIINTTSDPITQLATGFTADEISYIKRILDAMFETNNTLRHEVMAIQPIQAGKLLKPSNRRETLDSETQGSSGAQLTAVQGEKVLASLVEQGWFEKSRKNYYSLSSRALMELRGWLEQMYNDEDEDDDDGIGPRIKQCHACKDIVTYGQRCPKLTCLCRFHDSCAEGFFRMQRSKDCSLCKTSWTGEDFVGERADISRKLASRASNGNRTQAGPSTNNTSRNHARDINSDEDLYN